MADYFDAVAGLVPNASAAAVPFNGSAAPIGATETKAPRKEGELYLNVGIPVPVTDAETGEVRTEIVNLPFGLDLTNMPEATLKGLGPVIAGLRLMSNNLLNDMRSFGMTGLEPGDAKTLPAAVVTLRRAGRKVVTVPADRQESYAASVAALFGSAV